jgi:hypothetical protein
MPWTNQLSSPLVMPQKNSKLRRREKLTGKLALDIEELLALWVLAVVRSMQCDGLFANVEKLLTICIHHMLATGEREEFALYLEYDAAIDCLDAE